MINRVLIRIKVVQLLYSYLLVENRFYLESQPMPPTKEKRFAYGLYLDLLCLMAGIADGIKRRGGDRPLYDTRFIKSVISDEKVKSLLQKYRMTEFPLAPAEDRLIEEIKESALYKKYLKSEDFGSLSGERIWQEIFNIIILPNPVLNRLIAGMDNYTLGGVERMKGMMEDTFRNFYSASDNIPDAIETLRKSMDQARELYFRLLQLPSRLVSMREAEIEEQRSRYLATDEDRNPNLRFVENEFVEALNDNDEIRNFDEKYGLALNYDDEPMLRALLRAIMASDIYREYMEMPVTDFKADCEFWRNIFKNVIFTNPDFLEALEDKSVFWNDDIDTIGTFVLKTIKRFADDNEKSPILPMYKDEEDARFGRELFEAVLKNKDIYRGYIHDALDKNIWEAERMAYMDTVVLLTALAEILNFPKIPLTVSVNEYIEIAKAYSTHRSGQFVHGVLASIIARLRADGILHKE